MCLNTLEKQINYKFEMMLSAKVWNKQFLPQVCIFRAQLDIYDEDFYENKTAFGRYKRVTKTLMFEWALK